MPSIFFGFSGGGGGGSSFFFGMAYGPTSLSGPPAAGGVSCCGPLAGGLVWSSAASGNVEKTMSVKLKAISRIAAKERGRDPPSEGRERGSMKVSDNLRVSI